MENEAQREEDRQIDSRSVAEKAADDVQSIFDQLYPRSAIGLKRRALLPWWIKGFSYLYLIVSIGVPSLTVYALFGGSGIHVALYGIEYNTDHFDLLAALLLAGVSGAGTAAYGLLWGKSWGADAGMLTAGAGMALSLASLFLNDGFRLPLEPFLLVPFFIALWNRRKEWDPEGGD